MNPTIIITRSSCPNPLLSVSSVISASLDVCVAKSDNREVDLRRFYDPNSSAGSNRCSAPYLPQRACPLRACYWTFYICHVLKDMWKEKRFKIEIIYVPRFRLEAVKTKCAVMNGWVNEFYLHQTTQIYIIVKKNTQTQAKHTKGKATTTHTQWS